MQSVLKGKRIEYEVFGNGEPILFVHGWSGNRNSLRRLSQFLKGSYRCYLLDLPGRGDSENPDPNWGVDEHSELVKEFILNVIKVKKIIYIGTSFGGTIGVWLASSTNLISRLVLCAPSYRREKDYISNESLNVTLKDNVVTKLKSVLRKLKILRKLYYRVFYPHSELFKLSHLESNFLKVLATDLTDKLGKIACKTMAIYGEDDIDTPICQGYMLRRKVKNCILMIYSGYGHELSVYYPEVIEQDIKLFLSK